MDSSGRDEPLVSVIMIFFDVDTTFFQEAIESVRHQTYDRWELLLVDDGSSNGSTDVALRYARKHPDRVRYLEHEGHEVAERDAATSLEADDVGAEVVALALVGAVVDDVVDGELPHASLLSPSGNDTTPGTSPRGRDREPNGSFSCRGSRGPG